MDVKILAVCDTEKQYARRLMEAFSMMDGSAFRIHAFSAPEELHAFAQKAQIEVLLIADKLFGPAEAGLGAGKIILLSDGENGEAFPDYETVYKYQPAEQMMKEILSYYAEYAGAAAENYRRGKEFAVYGVYSPFGGKEQMILAEMFAGSWGKKTKTLLLNFQSYAAAEEQRGGEDVWDLTDLVYFLRQGKKTFSYKLGSIVRERNGFDEVLPMKFPEDLRNVTLGEWTELLEKISAESDYQVVVIDFGDAVNGLYELLSQCTEVYMPILQERISMARVENFEWILREKNFERLMESIHKVALPEDCKEQTQQVMMSEFVKRCVKAHDRRNERA